MSILVKQLIAVLAVVVAASVLFGSCAAKNIEHSASVTGTDSAADSDKWKEGLTLTKPHIEENLTQADRWYGNELVSNALRNTICFEAELLRGDSCPSSLEGYERVDIMRVSPEDTACLYDIDLTGVKRLRLTYDADRLAERYGCEAEGIELSAEDAAAFEQLAESLRAKYGELEVVREFVRDRDAELLEDENVWGCYHLKPLKYDKCQLGSYLEVCIPFFSEKYRDLCFDYEDVKVYDLQPDNIDVLLEFDLSRVAYLWLSFENNEENYTPEQHEQIDNSVARLREQFPDTDICVEYPVG